MGQSMVEEGLEEREKCQASGEQKLLENRGWKDKVYQSVKREVDKGLLVKKGRNVEIIGRIQEGRREVTRENI